MAEQTFLEEGGVTVTNSRFIVPGQTYAMSGITSVESITYKPSRIGPIIVIAIGLVAILAGGKEAVVGSLLFLAAGIAWWVLQKPKYSLVLYTASGTSREVLISKDNGFIARVVHALNEAIVARG